MENSTVKEKFHHLIDSIDDPKLLEGLYEAIIQLEISNNNKDILDSLTKEQLTRLEESLQQSYEGRVTPDFVVREKVERWLSK